MEEHVADDIVKHTRTGMVIESQGLGTCDVNFAKISDVSHVTVYFIGVLEDLNSLMAATSAPL